MKTKNNFYRNKYIIAMIEPSEFEFIAYVFDNANDMARSLNRPVDSINSSLHRLLNGDKSGMIINGIRYKIEFIRITKKEREEYGKETE
jgi:hypothetical protein